MNDTVKSGDFELDGEGNLYGPADYFEAKGGALWDSMLAGDDPVFNITLTIGGANPRKAMLDRLALDYASWKAAERLASA